MNFNAFPTKDLPIAEASLIKINTPLGLMYCADFVCSREVATIIKDRAVANGFPFGFTDVGIAIYAN